MRKFEKLNLLLVIILGIGLVYVGAQVQEIEKNVEEVQSTIVSSEIVIYNGTAEISKEVKLTKGSTALEALKRVATVETKAYPAIGKMITSINGVENNQSAGTYWLIGYRNSTEQDWKPAEVGVGSLELEDNQEILFWYGKASNAPFETEF